MGGGGGGPSGPVYHMRGKELEGFSTQKLLESKGLGNPYVDEELKRRNLDPEGKPIGPQWESQLDASTGLLKAPYVASAGPDITADMRGLEAFRKRALDQGPSAWSQLAKDQQGLEEAGLRSRLGQQLGGAQAQARAGLASRSGLSKGAAERLAMQGSRDQMMGMQGIAAEGAKARGQIGLQDEQMRQQALAQLPGMEIQATQPQFANRQMNLQTQQWNIGNALNENMAKRAAQQKEYSDKMQAWAGERQGQAMRESGGGGKK
jgi:hypothetical protein